MANELKTTDKISVFVSLCLSRGFMHGDIAIHIHQFLHESTHPVLINWSIQPQCIGETVAYKKIRLCMHCSHMGRWAWQGYIETGNTRPCHTYKKSWIEVAFSFVHFQYLLEQTSYLSLTLLVALLLLCGLGKNHVENDCLCACVMVVANFICHFPLHEHFIGICKVNWKWSLLIARERSWWMVDGID